MDVLAHLAFGVWLYHRYGSIWSIPMSFILDIDHLFGFAYDKKRKLRRDIPEIFQLIYRPRTWLHSITGIVVFLPLCFFIPCHIVLISIIAHLLMDGLDMAGVYIFPPFITGKIRGILPASYIVDKPESIRKHKNAHIPSIFIVVLFSFLILFG